MVTEIGYTVPNLSENWKFVGVKPSSVNSLCIL